MATNTAKFLLLGFFAILSIGQTTSALKSEDVLDIDEVRCSSPHRKLRTPKVSFFDFFDFDSKRDTFRGQLIKCQIAELKTFFFLVS